MWPTFSVLPLTITGIGFRAAMTTFRESWPLVLFGLHVDEGCELVRSVRSKAERMFNKGGRLEAPSIRR
jgi:hypothetical protein